MSTNHLLAAMDEVLEQGEEFLLGLSDAQYRDSAADLCNASIGSHYRHSLDHFKILLEAVNDGPIDYDRRDRDPRLESERLRALQVTRDFRHATRFLSAASLDKPVEARAKVSYAGEASAAASSFGREVMFAVSHAIHHHALIAMICGLRKIPVPQNFGMAPSTIEYLKSSATARRSA
jgi:hypothetical protein